jgi:hypothetical protein
MIAQVHARAYTSMRTLNVRRSARVENEAEAPEREFETYFFICPARKHKASSRGPHRTTARARPHDVEHAARLSRLRVELRCFQSQCCSTFASDGPTPHVHGSTATRADGCTRIVPVPSRWQSHSRGCRRRPTVSPLSAGASVGSVAACACSITQAATCAREVKPSFARMLSTWPSAVR